MLLQTTTDTMRPTKFNSRGGDAVTFVEPSDVPFTNVGPGKTVDRDGFVSVYANATTGAVCITGFNRYAAMTSEDVDRLVEALWAAQAALK